MKRILKGLLCLSLFIGSIMVSSCDLFANLMKTIELNADKYDLTLYKTTTAVATFEPLDCDDQEFTWSIENDAVASITPNGNTCEIEGLTIGSTTLKVLNERSGVFKEAQVNITHIELPTLKAIYDIEEETNVSVLGEVIFVKDNEFLLQDNTGIIRVKQSNLNVEKNNKYLISGDVIYDKCSLVFNNPNVELYEKFESKDDKFYSYFDNDALNVVSNNRVFDVRKIYLEGNLKYKSSVYSFKYDNKKVILKADSALNLTSFVGKDVIVSGYLYNYDSMSNEFFIYANAIENLTNENSLSVDDIELEFKNPNLSFNESYEVNVNYKNITNSFNKKVNYEIEDESIISIDKSNILKAKKVGNTQLTLVFNSNIRKTINVSVNNTNSISPISFEFEKSEYEATLYDEINLEFDYYPRRSSINLVNEIYLEDDSIGEINNGVLTLNGVGETVIHAKNEQGLETTATLISNDIVYNDGYSSIVEVDYNQSTYPVFENWDEIGEFYNDCCLHYYKSCYFYSTRKFNYSTEEDEYSDYYYLDENDQTSSHQTVFVRKEGNNYLYQILISYSKAGPNFLQPTTSKYDFINIENLVTSYRQDVINESQYKRDKSFNDFPITLNNKGELNVYTSDGLWLALEKHYLPKFPLTNSKAEKYYNHAKNILRNIISNDMNDLQKLRCIYDYICETYNYDYDSLEHESVSLYNYRQYIDGAFDFNKCVCDGFAKVFCLLASIEGIDCVRSYGFNFSESSGHAWNYARLNDTWYCICTTWAQSHQTFYGINSRPFDYTTYDYFLNKIDFFRSYFSLYHFHNIIDNPNYTRYNNIFKEEKIGNKTTYIKTYDEFKYVLDLIVAARKESYSFACLGFDSSVTSSTINKYISDYKKGASLGGTTIQNATSSFGGMKQLRLYFFN